MAREENHGLFHATTQITLGKFPAILVIHTSLRFEAFQVVLYQVFAFAYSHNPKSTDWFSETSKVSREGCIPSWSSGKLPRSGLRIVSQVNRRNHLSRKGAYGVGLKLAAAPPGAPKLMTVYFLSAEAQIGGFQVVS